MSLDDILKKYREEEEDSNSLSSDSLFGEEPETKNYFQRFSALNKSFKEEGKRKVREGWLAQSGWDFWVVKDDQWNFVQRWQLDRFIRTWLGRWEQAVGFIEQGISPALAGVMAIFEEPTIEEGNKEWGILQTISDTMDFAWDKFTQWLSHWLEEGTSFTEEQKAAGRVVGWEAFISAATFGLWKWISPAVKWAGRQVKKFGWKLNVTKKEAVDIYGQFIKQIDNESSVFWALWNNNDIRVKFQETLARVDGNLVSNIEDFGKKYNIDVTPIVKKARDINNKNFYEGKIFWKYINDLDNSVSASKAKEINAVLAENWHGTSKKKTSSAIRVANEQFWETQVKKALELNESNKFDLEQLNNIIEINRGKKDILWLDDADDLTFKWDSLKFAEDRGLIKRNTNVAEYSKWKADGFNITQKWYDLIQKSELYNDPYIQKKLLKWKDTGIAHYYNDDYSQLSKSIDAGKIDNSKELTRQYEKFILRGEVSNVDEGLLKMKAWISGWKEEALDAIININKSQKLWLDELIEKAIAWGDKELENLISKYALSKSTGFISEKAFKGAKNKVNFAQSIGVTNRVMNSLSSVNTKLSIKQIMWRVNESSAYKQLNRKIEKARTNLVNKNIKDKKKYASLIKEYKFQKKAIKYEFLAKSGAITSLKKEVVKDLRLKVKEFNLSSSVIDKFESKAYWKDAKTAHQFESAFKKATDIIEKEYTKSLFEWISKEFKKLSFVKKLDFKKSTTMDIQYAIELEKIAKVFEQKKYWEINIKDLEEILSEVKRLSSEWKDLVRRNEKANRIRINKIKENINKTLSEKWIKADPETLKEKIFDKFDKLDNTTLFQYRLMEKIFDKNPEALDTFVLKIETAFNEFEKWEQVTKLLADNILKELNKDVAKLEEFWDILLARNVEYVDDWVFHSGLARQIYDKNSKSLFNTKLDTPLEMNQKPKWLETLPDTAEDLISWDEIRKTKLWETLLKHDDPTYQRVFKIWDKFFDLQGKRLKDVAARVDNIDVTINEKYSPFEVKDRNLWDLDYTIWDIWNVNNNHISKWGLKKRNLLADIKKVGHTYENNPIKLLYWQSRTSRYYVNMQEALKDAQRVYNGYWKKFKNMSIDEINELKKSKDGELVFSYLDRKIQVFTDDIDDAGNIKTVYVKPDTWENIVEYVPSSKLEVIDNTWGVKNFLSKEENKRMDIFLKTVSQGWNRFASESDRTIAKVANHFNSLPLLFNLSSASKQPLSIIDSIPLVGLSNLTSASKDIFSNKKLFKELDNRGAINARIHGWPDYNIREMANRNLANRGVDNKVAKAYNQYVEAWFWMLQNMDSVSYKTIWAWAYKKLLMDNWYLKKGEKLTVKHLTEWDEVMVKLMSEADVLANKSASTANPLFLPQAYRSSYNKMFAGLMTTQMNRMQNIYKMWPELFKDGKYTELGTLVSTNLTANYLDYLVWMEVGKALYNLWFEEWEWYAQDQKDILINKEVLMRITVGQSLFLGKFWDLSSGFSPSPMISAITNIAKDTKPFLEWDAEMKDVSKIIVDSVLGKGWKYIHNQAF